jgi:uncharacterized membrane protein (UPF0127 family)
MRILTMVLAFFLTWPALAVGDDSHLAKIEPVAIETSQGTTTFLTEIADTNWLRARGLMFRHKLPEDHAMLFDFKETRPVMMWMKNTRISLDMIFVRADGSVARVVENTVPMSETIIDSGEPVAYVIEVAAGTARRIGLKPGDKVISRLIGSASG